MSANPQPKKFKDGSVKWNQACFGVTSERQRAKIPSGILNMGIVGNSEP